MARIVVTQDLISCAGTPSTTKAQYIGRFCNMLVDLMLEHDNGLSSGAGGKNHKMTSQSCKNTGVERGGDFFFGGRVGVDGDMSKGQLDWDRNGILIKC